MKIKVFVHLNDLPGAFEVMSEQMTLASESGLLDAAEEVVLCTNGNPDSFTVAKEILNKEENKYRFNQFWDITKNRGEFPPGFNLPMFNTEANGYIYPINPLYVNYNKPVLERKKFRHNANKVFLRRFVSGNNKFLFKISKPSSNLNLRIISPSSFLSISLHLVLSWFISSNVKSNIFTSSMLKLSIPPLSLIYLYTGYSTDEMQLLL